MPVAPIAKLLGQADLLASSGDSRINFAVSGNEVKLYDENVNSKVTFEGNCPEFEIPLNSSQFKSIIGHVDADTISLCPAYMNDEIVGLTIWTDNLTVMVGALDSEG